MGDDEFAKAVLGAVAGRLDRSSSGTSQLEEALRAALARAKTQSFVNPLPPSLGANGEMSHLWKLIADTCSAWEAAEIRRGQAHQEEIARLTRERLTTEQIEHSYRLLNADLSKAQESISALEKTKQFQEREIAAFKRLLEEKDRADPDRLRYLESELVSLRERMRELYTRRSPPPKTEQRKAAVTPPRMARPSAEGGQSCDMALKIAELEAGPLLQCPAEERTSLQKKLLLKWHPDKQPSEDHAMLAKRVMQALQNLPQWSK